MCGSYVLHFDDIVPFKPVPEVSGAVFSRALPVVTLNVSQRLKKMHSSHFLQRLLASVKFMMEHTCDLILLFNYSIWTQGSRPQRASAR